MALVHRGIIAPQRAALRLKSHVQRERTSLLREEELAETVLYAPWVSIAQEQPRHLPIAPRVNMVAFQVFRLRAAKADANLVPLDGNAQLRGQ
jgi:hypothetical protein